MNKRFSGECEKSNNSQISLDFFRNFQDFPRFLQALHGKFSKLFHIFEDFLRFFQDFPRISKKFKYFVRFLGIPASPCISPLPAKSHIFYSTLSS